MGTDGPGLGADRREPARTAEAKLLQRLLPYAPQLGTARRALSAALRTTWRLQRLQVLPLTKIQCRVGRA